MTDLIFTPDVIGGLVVAALALLSSAAMVVLGYSARRSLKKETDEVLK